MFIRKLQFFGYLHLTSLTTVHLQWNVLKNLFKKRAQKAAQKAAQKRAQKSAYGETRTRACVSPYARIEQVFEQVYYNRITP